MLTKTFGIFFVSISFSAACGLLLASENVGIERVFDEISRVNQAAKGASQEGDYESLQSHRDQRLRLMAYAWLMEPSSDSQWIKAINAILTVNGWENALTASLFEQGGDGKIGVKGLGFAGLPPEPCLAHLGVSAWEELRDYRGLVDQCDYDEALRVLQEFSESSSGLSEETICGEIALIYAEVFNQAKAVVPTASEQSGEALTTDFAKVIRIIREARDRDPCCLPACKILELCLTRPSAAEAFLRADVREDYSERQRELARLAYPGGQDDEILESYGPVEFAKARNIGAILSDLSYARPLKSDEPVFDNSGNFLYVVPAELLQGTDGRGLPFCFLYGRAILSTVTDKKGRSRTAFLFINNDGEWERLYVDILWLGDTPGEESRAGRTLSRIPAVKQSKLDSGRTVYLYDFPCDNVESVLQLSSQIWRLKDSLRLFSDIQRGRSLGSHYKDTRDTKGSPIQSSPMVAGNLEALEANKDRTALSIEQLLNRPRMNPLILVSDGDNVDSEPVWDLEDNDIGLQKTLMLDDGKRLNLYQNEEHPEIAWFELQRDAVRMRYPLTFSAIPSDVLLATPFGAAAAYMLRKVGYEGKEISDELTKYVSAIGDGREYTPSRFKTLVARKARTGGVTNWTAAWEVFAEAVNETLPESLRESGQAIQASIVDARAALVKSLREQRQRPPYDLSSFPQAYVSRLITPPDQLFFEYGFRYVVGPRGNLVINRQLSTARPAELGQAAGDSGGGLRGGESVSEYPFDIRAPQGGERIAATQIYTMDDYRDLHRNQIDEHLGPMLMLSPCFPALEEYIRATSSSIVDPSGDSNSQLKSVRDSGRVSTGGGPSVGGGPEKFPVSVAAFSKEFVQTRLATSEEEIVTSLNHLYVAYASLWADVAKWREDTAKSRSILKILDFFRMYGLLNEENKKLFDSLKEDFDKDLEGVDSGSVLEAVQLEAARGFAEDGKSHRAIVFYNDLLASEIGRSGTDANFNIFLEVADRSAVERFEDKLRSVVQDERDAIILELELAGVLRKSRFKESAAVLLRRIVDEYDFVIGPAIELARDYIISYGLRIRPALNDAVAELKDLVGTARAALQEFNISVDWRESAFAERDSDDVMALRAEEIEAILGEAQSAEASRKRLQICLERGRRKVSFPVWLKWQKAVRAQPTLAFMGDYVVSPNVFIPCDYIGSAQGEGGDGFERHAYKRIEMFAEDDFRQFCEGDLDGDLRDPETAAVLSAVLAWYWIDQGDAIRANRAMRASVEFSLEAEAKAGMALTKLVHKRNGLAGVIAAGTFFQRMPGVGTYRIGFGRGLVAQLVMWEREWFAAGLFGPHATAEADTLQAALDRSLMVAKQSSSEWREGRYFFPDYKFTCRALPDVLLIKLLLEQREFADARIEAKDVAEKGDEAVQEEKWGFKSDDEARNWLLGGFAGGYDLQEDIVFGAEAQ